MFAAWATISNTQKASSMKSIPHNHGSFHKKSLPVLTCSKKPPILNTVKFIVMSSSDTPTLRRKILDCARRLMITDGYTDLSMRKIANEVGCSATSIYLYFDNKDALLHALIEEGFDLLMKACYQVLERDSGTLAKLLDMLNAYIQFAIDQPEYYSVMFSLRPAQMSRYPADKFRKARKGIELTAELLKQAEKEGIIESGQDTYLLAWYMWSNMHGGVMLMLSQRLDVKIEPREFVRTIVERTLSSLLQDVELMKKIRLEDDLVPTPKMRVRPHIPC
jgi:AcrR family transcriptional regulator